MTQVSCTRVVRARPEQVWRVLADFGAVSAWADGIDHSCLLHHRDASPIGTTRRIQVGRDTFVETITEFDPNRVLAYEIAGLPRAVAASNRWTLLPDSPTTTVATLTSTVHVTRGPLRRVAEHIVARAMTHRMQTLLTSLATASEGVTT